MDLFFLNSEKTVQNGKLIFTSEIKTSDKLYRLYGYCLNAEVVIDVYAYIAPEKMERCRYGESMSVRDLAYSSLLYQSPALGIREAILNDGAMKSPMGGKSVLYHPFNRPRKDILSFASKYGLKGSDSFVFERFITEIPIRITDKVKSVKVVCEPQISFSPIQRAIDLSLCGNGSKELGFINPFTKEKQRLIFCGFIKNKQPDGSFLLLLKYMLAPDFPEGFELLFLALGVDGTPLGGAMQTGSFLSSEQNSKAKVKISILGALDILPAKVTVEVMGILKNNKPAEYRLL